MIIDPSTVGHPHIARLKLVWHPPPPCTTQVFLTRANFSQDGMITARLGHAPHPGY